jgi:hypothetical protein
MMATDCAVGSRTSSGSIGLPIGFRQTSLNELTALVI